VADGVRRRAFAKAVETLGGAELLAKHLRVSKALAIEWANGTLPIPDFVFLKVIDLILDVMSAEELSGSIEIQEDPAMAATRLKPDQRGNEEKKQG
jgi:hypothetical protein